MPPTKTPTPQGYVRERFPTPYTRSVVFFEHVHQTHRALGTHYTIDEVEQRIQVMAHMEEEIRQLRRTVGQLDERAGRYPRYPLTPVEPN